MTNEARNYSLEEIIITPPTEKNANPISLGSDGTVVTDFEYRESILSETIKCNVTYTDIGQYRSRSGVNKTILEGMPLEGGEYVSIKLKDLNHDITLSFKMRIRFINQIYKDTTKSIVSLDLVSEEMYSNYEKVVVKRYDGKISDSVKSILTDSQLLNTRKKLDIEPTQNNLNFFGYQRRPFYFLSWLANYAVPEGKDAKGNTAGYFFFETYKGFQFKSIENLLSRKEKEVKKYGYNQTVNVPIGYSGKILELDPPNPSGDAIKKLEAGTYSTRTILFDPFSCYYEVIYPNAYSEGGLGSEEKLNKAGKKLPKVNPKIGIADPKKEFTKTKYYLLDTGTLPSGNTKTQIQKSKTQNFDPRGILNQSSMRYNQLFSSQTTITIFGDFGLHAGDLIEIDIPELSNKQTKEMDEYLGGDYVIADLCHYYSIAHGCFTKITAVRDSTGKKRGTDYKPF